MLEVSSIKETQDRGKQIFHITHEGMLELRMVAKSLGFPIYDSLANCKSTLSIYNASGKIGKIEKTKEIFILSLIYKDKT